MSFVQALPSSQFTGVAGIQVPFIGVHWSGKQKSVVTMVQSTMWSGLLQLDESLVAEIKQSTLVGVVQ